MLLAIAAAALAAPAEPAAPRLLGNGWFYGEVGRGCMAARALPDGARLLIRLVKWNDLSDSLVLWRPGLPPLMSESGLSTGRSAAEEEADAAANFDLAVSIDGRPIGAAMGHFQLLDFEGRPGPSYRLGILQSEFIAALRAGRRLEIRRRGALVAAFPIDRSAAMAAEMARCVALDP